tara:strand:- start:63 stop:263 length:201 start_codon:yes stop_codon:yes gene_type:complete
MLNLSNQEIRPPYTKYPHAWIAKIEDENRQRMGHATVRALKISGAPKCLKNTFPKESFHNQIKPQL